MTAFLEVKARFDEESNLQWAEELERAGIKVLYSFPGLKVHAKLCLVSRREHDSLKLYAYLGTGNFNERTAGVYTDHGFFTADHRITEEVAQVFEILARKVSQPDFRHLLVSPFNMRERLYDLIKNEKRNAHMGRPASIIAKMNSLEDRGIIARLYEASEAGVRVDLIVRGICCLVPGIAGMSRNIRVISIIDRFLEHARVFVFHNSGQPLTLLSSADWMKRNLSRRIEVAFPIYDLQLQRELHTMINFQLRDTAKARLINRRLTNPYRHSNVSEPLRAQTAIYEYLKT